MNVGVDDGKERTRRKQKKTGILWVGEEQLSFLTLVVAMSLSPTPVCFGVTRLPCDGSFAVVHGALVLLQVLPANDGGIGVFILKSRVSKVVKVTGVGRRLDFFLFVYLAAARLAK